MDNDRALVRRDFAQAAHAFVETVGRVRPQDWAAPGLGVWSLRDLTGHTSRALLTVESYLAPATTTERPTSADAAAYYAAAGAAGALTDAAAIAERGRQAGLALGDDPAAEVAGLAERVLGLVEQADDSALVTTPFTTMTLIGYLPTRTFELVVHTLDIAVAGGVRDPGGLEGPLTRCLTLAAGLAVAGGQGPEVLLALTGRRPLPAGFSVL